jgi:uncharacterized damage-inducible protein DinB
MIYHSWEEIYEAKHGALQKLSLHIQDLSPAQATVHPSGGGWSIAEIAEHLVLVESQILQLITALLKKTEAAGQKRTDGEMFEVSLQSMFEQSRTEKYNTHDKYVPTGAMAIADALQRLEEVQAQLDELKPRLRNVDLTYATFPHWTFGPLNLGEWLAFIGLHEERHLLQIQSILASSEFEGFVEE